MFRRPNKHIPLHPAEALPEALPLPYDAIYDEHGELRPWIITDRLGRPRADVVYDRGQAYDLQGYPLDARGERVGPKENA